MTSCFFVVVLLSLHSFTVCARVGTYSVVLFRRTSRKPLRVRVFPCSFLDVLARGPRPRPQWPPSGGGRRRRLAHVEGRPPSLFFRHFGARRPRLPVTRDQRGRRACRDGCGGRACVARLLRWRGTAAGAVARVGGGRRGRQGCKVGAAGARVLRVGRARRPPVRWRTAAAAIVAGVGGGRRGRHGGKLGATATHVLGMGRAPRPRVRYAGAELAWRSSRHCCCCWRRPPLLIVLAAATTVIMNKRGGRLPHVSWAWNARGGRAHAARVPCRLRLRGKAWSAAAAVVKVTRWGRPPHAC